MAIAHTAAPGHDQPKVRLSNDEVAAIKAAACAVFGPGAHVRLFGSRVDPARRGGDIDLLIEVGPGQDSIPHEARFLGRLFTRIDEQKVDLLLMVRGAEPTPFQRVALAKAVLL